MLSLPEKYRKDAAISKVTFVRGAKLSGAEKKRFETAVESIRLLYQIEGFDIPNLVTDEYNCQAIMFIQIMLTDMKQAAFIAKTVQKCIAPLCVIELTDGANAVYSFADKRLSKQSERQFVICDEYLSDKLPLNYQSDEKTLFALYIDYDTILNRSNKHCYYLEMMCKAFLVFNHGLYSGSDGLLDSKFWYDESRLKRVLPLLKELKALKIAAAKADTLAERSNINRQIKETIKELEDFK